MKELGDVRIWPARRFARLGLFGLAVLGAPAGIGVLWIHLAGDPLADVRADYDAGARLKAGLPLYPADTDPNTAEFYRYPPLLAIGQAQVPLTLLTATGAPWSIPLAANLKLFPALVALWFLGTLTLGLVGEVRNISPYAVSPLLWAVLVGAGAVLALRLAPTRWGWAAAVALSVLATPRLLVCMLMTLPAALRPAPRDPL